jgi:hypothetical protein
LIAPRMTIYQYLSMVQNPSQYPALSTEERGFSKAGWFPKYQRLGLRRMSVAVALRSREILPPYVQGQTIFRSPWEDRPRINSL